MESGLGLNHQPLPETEMQGWLEIQRREIGITGSNMPSYRCISIGSVYGCLLVPIVVYLNKVCPWWQGSWGQHGAHLEPTGPRWAPCWPHELCYLGCHLLKGNFTENTKDINEWNAFQNANCTFEVTIISPWGQGMKTQTSISMG